MTGCLVLVATPIGNLGDLTPRAVETLASADAVCCEDTRRTGRLLQLAGVPRRPFVVANEHTEAAAVDEVLDRLARGETVAVVSDAGIPGVSDPGERLVRAAVAAGHDVSVVPGASAAIAALVVSGLPTGRFVVEGFLPRTGSSRTERLQALAGERRTIVLYEAPHRLARTLVDLAAVLGGERPVAIVRELTKLHEEVWRGSLADALERAGQVAPRGEHVLVVAGAPAPGPPDGEVVDAALRAALGRGLHTKEAAAEVAGAFGLPRRSVYERALELTSDTAT